MSKKSSKQASEREGSASSEIQTAFPLIMKKMEHPQLMRMISRQKAKNVGRGSKFTSILYNKETGAVLDRTGREWIRVLLFYFVYYIVLFGMISLLLVFLLNAVVDDRIPIWMGPGTIIGNSPNLKVIAPALRVISPNCPIIQYNSSDPKSYAPYTESIRKILRMYKNKDPDEKTTFDCRDQTMYAKKSMNDFENSCVFDVTDEELRDCACKDAVCANFDKEYQNKSPCVAIGLNKVINWTPDKLPYVQNCNDDRIKFTCNGKKLVDEEHYESVKVYPERGMSSCYFPFYNQKTWQEPFVMIQLINPKPGVFINMECSGTAKNLVHHPEIGQAMVKVDFLVKQ